MTHLAVHAEPPRHRRGLPPELAVDEVADAADEQAEARERHREVEHVGHIALAPIREQGQRDDYAEEPTVEGHAAFPDLQRVPGILHPEVEAVEQHVADAAAEDDAEHGVKHEVIDIAGIPGAARARGATPREPPRGPEAD